MTTISAHDYLFFFFNDTATTEIYTLSLHDALPISLLGHGGGLPVVADRQAEEVHVREEDRQGRDQAEEYQQGQNGNLQEEQEEGCDGRGDHRADGGERGVHPGHREVFFGAQSDVRAKEAVLELRVFFPASLNELPEHAPRDLLLRSQAHAHGLRALRQFYHVRCLIRLLPGPAPLRLRERPARLELLKCAATQPSHLRLRRPSRVPAPAVPSPRGPASRFRPGTGNTAH